MEQWKSPRPEVPPLRQRRPEDEEHNQRDIDQREDDIDLPTPEPKQHVTVDDGAPRHEDTAERAVELESNSAPKTFKGERRAPRRAG